MVQEKKFNQQPQKNQQMPERNQERSREEFSGQSKTTQRPEIDLPLKGGRSEADLSQTRKDDKSSTKNTFEKPVRK